MSKGPIKTLLDQVGSDLKQRANTKVLALVSAANKLSNKQKTFTLDNITVTITKGPTSRELSNGFIALEFELSANKNGKELILDNPFQFVNPPILNADGVEDAIGVVQRILVDVIKATAK